MKSDQWKDPRSTGRKFAQRVLDKLEVPYVCGARPNNGRAPYSCGRSQETEPDMILDVNHRNKNIKDNDPINLERLCRSCHKLFDGQTAKGVSSQGDEFGYESV